MVVTTTALKAAGSAATAWPPATAHDDGRSVRASWQLHTHTYIIRAPVYLTEPLNQTKRLQTVATEHRALPCLPAVEVPRAKGEIPHHLAGARAGREFAKKNNTCR